MALTPLPAMRSDRRRSPESLRTAVVDLLIDEILLIELKAVKALDDMHKMQCINYLKATGLPLCLLLNFGKPRLEIKRVVQRL